MTKPPNDRSPAPAELQARSAWPTTFFSRIWPSHADEAPDVIDHLRVLRGLGTKNIESAVAPAAKSTEGLYESRFDLFDTNKHPGLGRLIAWIDTNVCEAVSVMNGRRTPPDKLRVTFLDSWFHITTDGGFHDAHYHSGSSWCGIFYLQSGDSATAAATNGAGNGVNRFYAPLPTGGMLDDYGNAYLTHNRIDIAPRDGLLVLFPSHIMHSALLYRGACERVIISFNTRTDIVS